MLQYIGRNAGGELDAWAQACVLGLAARQQRQAQGARDAQHGLEKVGLFSLGPGDDACGSELLGEIALEAAGAGKRKRTGFDTVMGHDSGDGFECCQTGVSIQDGVEAPAQPKRLLMKDLDELRQEPQRLVGGRCARLQSAAAKAGHGQVEHRVVEFGFDELTQTRIFEKGPKVTRPEHDRVEPPCAQPGYSGVDAIDERIRMPARKIRASRSRQDERSGLARGRLAWVAM